MQALGKNRLRKAKDRRLAFDDVLADLKEAVLASNITTDDVSADLKRQLVFTIDNLQGTFLSPVQSGHQSQ